MPLGECDLLRMVSGIKSSDDESKSMQATVTWLSPLHGALQALRTLHRAGLVFANLDPTNIIKFGNTWKLADVDFVTEIGDTFR